MDIRQDQDLHPLSFWPKFRNLPDAEHVIEVFNG
jgi:hypothetical protein